LKYNTEVKFGIQIFITKLRRKKARDGKILEKKLGLNVYICENTKGKARYELKIK
jgi:hypothetical protein